MCKLSIFAITATLLAFAACNSDKTGRAAAHAADLVNVKAKEVKEDARDLAVAAVDGKKDLRLTEDDVAAKVAHDVTNDTQEMTRAVKELDQAQSEFAYHKTVRIQTLRAVHAISASQANVVRTITAGFPLVVADRTRVTEKLGVFDARIDDSAKLVQGLEAVDAAAWVARERAAADAMNRLEDARLAAWAALEHAKTVDGPTSMR